MNKKIKQKRVMIFLLAVILAIAVLSLVSDKEELTTVVVLKEELDNEQLVSEQLGKFIEVSINKADYESMGSSLVGTVAELNQDDLKISIPLTVGSPIPKSLIEFSKRGGELTNSLAVYRTWFKIDNSTGALPPGVAEGDNIDIGILYTDEETKLVSLGMLLYGVKIASIQETNVYLEVTQEDFGKLTVAQRVGNFVLQLPGKKDTGNCGKLTPEQKEVTDCYNDYDRPTFVNTQQVVNQLKNNGAGSTNAERIFEKNVKLLVNEGVLFDLLKGENNGTAQTEVEVPVEEETEGETDEAAGNLTDKLNLEGILR